MSERTPDDLRRMTAVEQEECSVAHLSGECSRVTARRERCQSGLHNYIVPRSYVQISAKRYVQVCWFCGQTDYMDGEAPQ